MSERYSLAILTALPGVLAFLTALLGWLKSRQTKQEIVQTKEEIIDLHTSINSKMDRLLLAVESEAHARGVVNGLAQAKSEADARQAVADHAAVLAHPPEKEER